MAAKGGMQMTPTPAEAAALQEVRELEQARMAAIRSNDADAMNRILDDKFLFINGDGRIYDKADYIRSVRCHELTYAADLELTETDHRVDGDLVILAGM